LDSTQSTRSSIDDRKREIKERIAKLKAQKKSKNQLKESNAVQQQEGKEEHRSINTSSTVL